MQFFRVFTVRQGVCLVEISYPRPTEVPASVAPSGVAGPFPVRPALIYRMLNPEPVGPVMCMSFVWSSEPGEGEFWIGAETRHEVAVSYLENMSSKLDGLTLEHVQEWADEVTGVIRAMEKGAYSGAEEIINKMKAGGV